jgi:glycosyltransferase involved in cell wall biosynthesis
VPKEPFALSVGRLWDSGKQSLLLCRPGLSMDTILVGPTEHPVVKTASLPRVPGLSLPGQLSDVRVRQLFSFARVYVGTSRYEPFGLAPLEGALSRCALLLNDISSFREIWADTAIYFRTDDGDDLAHWMTRLAGDAELCRTLGAAAWRRARERYTAARMVQEYTDLYQHIAGSVVEAEPHSGWREVA